jgi:hypothetical protein
MRTACSGPKIGLGAVLFLLVPVLAAHASTARAQDPLAAARAELEAARFSEAVRLYDTAYGAPSGLDRASLLRLLRERALARSALRDTDGARRDLVALFSLDQGAQFGSEAAPSFMRLIDEARASVREPLSLAVEALRIDGGYRIVVRAAGDRSGLARSVRVSVLTENGVETFAGPVAEILRDGDLRYVVEAIGPGGAVVASLGSIDAPQEARAGDLPGVLDGTGGGDDPAPWIAIGIGAGVVLLAVGVALAVFFSVTSDLTRPIGPMEINP